VRRFGDGLGIVGDRFNNAVRVELDYGQEGTIRVFGLGNTRILAGSANVIQVSEFEVLVPEFAHDQSFENGRPQLRERDLFIHLHDGDDRLQIAGGDTEARVVTVDDLFINMGKRQSIVEIDNLIVWDTVVFLSGSEQDELSLTGRTEMRALRVLTGGGNDDVRIGVPGAAVFEGVDPGRVQIGGFLESIDNGHGGTIAAPFLRMSLISTGSGNDNVWLAGGDFYDTVVVLGAGSDQFECTSARIWRGRLHDSNAEKVAFKECIVEGLRACWENTYLCV
jgi:hypothetical protein